MHAAKHVVTRTATAEASAVIAMVATAAVVAVPEANAVTDQMHARRVAPRLEVRAAVSSAPTLELTFEPMDARKSARKVGVMSDVNAAMSLAARINAVLKHAVNSVRKARTNASHAQRVSQESQESPAKAVARSAHAASGVSAQTAAMSRAHQWTPLNKTSPWPTRPPWLRLWAVRQLMPAKKPPAVSEENGVANEVAATSAVMSRRVNHVQNHAQSHEQSHAQSARTLPVQRFLCQVCQSPGRRVWAWAWAWTSMRKLTTQCKEVRQVNAI